MQFAIFRMAFVLQDKIIGVPTKSVYLNPGYWLAILLFFGLPLYSLAQTKNLPFQQLLLGKGQDINMVYKVLRDRRGFMWFGTFNGLVRYDGSHFKHYPFDPETRHPMKGKRTEGLLESKSGGIWVLSGQRLLYHVPERDTFYRFDELLGAEPLGYANSKINPALLQDSSDQLWIRSERGLFGIKPSQNGPPFQLRHYQYPEKDSASQSSNRIQVLLYD
ncbi:MAG: hypothetical protein KDC44_04430, partial [Phaeodactylibacter sp.]|nr:hypothetical protein [Phaeodactylibacter sp.]